MIVLKRKIGLVALDVLCIKASMLLAFLLRYDWTMPELYSTQYWLIVTAAMVVAVTVFYFFSYIKACGAMPASMNS